MIKEFTDVDIMLNPDTFKSTYDILLEISKVWQNLTDAQQAVLLEKIAGKHRASAVAALLNDQKTLVTAYEDALNSAGSAQEEFDKRTESVEYHLSQLKNAWQVFASNSMTVDFLNGIIDALTRLLEKLNESGGVLSLLIPAFLSLSVLILSRFVPALITAGEQAIRQGASLGVLSRMAGDNVTAQRLLVGTISKLKLALVSLGVSLGVVFVAFVAFKGVQWVMDWWKDQVYAVDNLTESIENLKGELNTLQNEYDELANKQNRTAGEDRQLENTKARIELLEKQIEVQEKQKTDTIVSHVSDYYNGGFLSGLLEPDTEFTNVMQAATKTIDEYSESLARIEQNNNVINKKTEDLKNLTEGSLAYISAQNEISDAERKNEYEYEKNNNLLIESCSRLEEVREQRGLLLSVLDDLTGAEQLAAEEQLANLDATIREWEITVGLADTTEHLTENINTQKASLEVLNATIAKVNSGQVFTKQQLEELAQLYPELSDLVTKYGQDADGGYTLSKDAISQLNKTQASAMLNMINAEISLTETTIQNVNNRIRAYRTEIEELKILYQAQMNDYKVKSQQSWNEYRAAHTKKVDDYHYEFEDGYSYSHWKSNQEASILDQDINYQNYINQIDEALKEREDARSGLLDLYKKRNELEAQVNSFSVETANAPSSTSVNTSGSGSSSSDKEDEIELWDRYANSIEKAKDELEKYDIAIEKTQSALELNQSYEERTPELLVEEQNLYDKLLEQQEEKRKATNDALWEQNYQLELWYERAQQIAGVDFHNMTGAQIDEWFGTKNNLDKDSLGYKELEQVLDGIKNGIDYSNELGVSLNDIKQTMHEISQEQIEVKFTVQDDALKKLENARSIVERTKDDLSDISGAEKQRIQLNRLLITSYQEQRKAIEDMIAANAEDLEILKKKYGETSQVYLDALKKQEEQQRELHEQALDNLRAEYDARKEILELEQEENEKLLEQSYYGSEGQDIWNDRKQEEIDALEDQLKALEDANNTDEEDYLKEVEEKEKEIAELQEKLNNLRNQKTIQQLERQEDGSFQWKYVEDQKAINETLDELQTAKEELDEIHKDKQLEDEKQAIQDKIDAINKEVDDRQTAYERELHVMQQSYEDQMDTLDSWYVSELNSLNRRIESIKKFGKDYESANKVALETAAKTVASGLLGLNNIWATGMAGVFLTVADNADKIVSKVQSMQEAISELKRASSSLEGSNERSGTAAIGLKRVEKNDMPIRVHYGERILTRQEAERYNSIEDELTSGRLEEYLKSIEDGTFNSISNAAASNVDVFNRTPDSVTNNRTESSIIIQNVELPNVQEPVDFAAELEKWSRNEFGGLAQKARILKAK